MALRKLQSPDAAPAIIALLNAGCVCWWIAAYLDTAYLNKPAFLIVLAISVMSFPVWVVGLRWMPSRWVVPVSLSVMLNWLATACALFLFGYPRFM